MTNSKFVTTCLLCGLLIVILLGASQNSRAAQSAKPLQQRAEVEGPLPPLEQVKIFVAQDFPYDASERLTNDVNNWLSHVRNIEIISRGELQTAFPPATTKDVSYGTPVNINTGKITIMLVYHYRVK